MVKIVQKNTSKTMVNIDSISYWERKTFFENIDFLVIGAGIVGYSTALHLREMHPKASILIIERGIMPSGASSKNAGFACFGSATELYDDLQHINEDTVWDTVKLRWKGLMNLKSLIGDELKLETNGSWDLITEDEFDLYEKTIPLLPDFNKKIEEITGEKDVYSVDEDVAEKFGFNNVRSSIYNRLEGQIDTSSMNASFYKKAIEANINVLFGIEAQQFIDKDSNQLQTSFGIIDASKIAICTNGFAQPFLPDEEINPARAQVLITEPIDDLPFEGTFHYQQGYYYFRNIDGRILFGGGRNLDFKGETTTQLVTTPKIIEELKHLLNTVVLPGKDINIDHTWAGIMGTGPTKKPIIKKCGTNLYCGVRLGGMGVAIGSLVGKELAELMR